MRLLRMAALRLGCLVRFIFTSVEWVINWLNHGVYTSASSFLIARHRHKHKTEGVLECSPYVIRVYTLE